MGRLFSVLITIVMTVGAGWAQTPSPVSITSEDWTAVADGEQGTLAISHKYLGTVMKDVRLNLLDERGLAPLKNWSIEKKGQNQLFIRTAKPITGWQVELGPNTLKLSSTTASDLLDLTIPVPGENYSLFLYDPKSMSASQVRAVTEGNREVPVNHELRGNLLSVNFQGQQEAVDWEVNFAANIGK